MAEHTIKHNFVIDKWKRNGRICKLTIRRKAQIHKPIFSITINPPVPAGLFNTPEWVKDFVHKMNTGEIRIRIKDKEWKPMAKLHNTEA